MMRSTSMKHIIGALHYGDLNSVSKLQNTQNLNLLFITQLVVKKIANEMDLMLVDLQRLLPPAIIMVVSVTASPTRGKHVLQKTIDACDSALALDSAKKMVLDFVENSSRGYPTGQTGRSLRAEIHKKIEKWQEPPPTKQPRKKRGGRRFRKMKERYAITDMWKLANRMQFGVPEESSLGDGLVAKKFKVKSFGSSGATSGLTSSRSFTSLQGIELLNPQANQFGGTVSTYFSESGSFSKIRRT
ncbi:hypothetical protein AAHA92_07836 [Salvia divinorum]|uniref:Prp31 C-terminal domain-containing protein n=1 Tax=Salvia divinorum TaxID=28513 RepID=A0ABD1IA97_SALDI